MRPGDCAATVHFDRITVTGAEISMMAATLADADHFSRTAQEPEVKDLADCYSRWGPKLKAPESTIRIEGVKRLHGADHTIIGDRSRPAFLIRRDHTGDLTVRLPGGASRIADRQAAQAAWRCTEEDGASLRVRSPGPAVGRHHD